ncbi:MAG: NUDIX domain-containing protein [Clostridia bacterium]|nr:NUDIX domain-containing protein [Clostridia bacterium]
MHVIVGGVLEKNGKVLLVQETQKKCYKKWNIPAGHLDCNETLIQGAIREIKEETGCDVELTGILNIANRVIEDDILVTIIFSTKIVKETSDYMTDEILDRKWYNYDDILNHMDEELRDLNFVKQPVANLKNNKIAPIDIVNQL